MSDFVSDMLSRQSSALVFSGVLTIAFGAVAVIWPNETLLTLLYLFAAYLLIAGAARAVRAFAGVGNVKHWVLAALLGLFELGVGVYLVRHVKVTFSAFILLIGFVLIARGVIGLVESLVDRVGDDSTRLLRFVAGALALVVGIVVLFQPAAAGVGFVWLLGAYALVVGSIEIALASKLGKVAKQ